MDEEQRKGELVQAAMRWGAEPEAQPKAQLEDHPDLSPNAEELKELFLAYSSRVYRAAYRVTGNSMDAEDVLQTVFLRLLRREGSLPSSDSAGRYLHLSAVNGALDLLRARRSACSGSLDDAQLPSMESPQPGPERALADLEMHEKLRESLSRLAPMQARAFALRYFEGYGNKEIAKMLGTSRTVVAVSLHRARKKIQKGIRSWMLGGRP